MATVKELRDKLNNLSYKYDNYLVILEGCDCSGHWSGDIDLDTIDGGGNAAIELYRGGVENVIVKAEPQQPEWAKDIPIGELP